MDLKKYIQQQAGNDAENLLTEDDRQYCMKLAEEAQANPAVSRRPNIKLWTGVASACAVALAAVVVIPVALTRGPADDVYYNDENINSVTCLIQDINANSNVFEIITVENTLFKYELFYDTVTSDKLYYSVNVTSDLSKFYLYIVVNPKFDLKFETGTVLQNKQLTDYSVKYENVTADEFSEYEARYKGSIESGAETVYIEYNQLIDLGEQAFFDDIQSVLKVKK